MPRATRQNQNVDVDFRGEKLSNATMSRPPTRTPGLTRNPRHRRDAALHRACADGEQERHYRLGRPDPCRRPCRTACGAGHNKPPFPRIDPTADTGRRQGLRLGRVRRRPAPGQACVTPHVVQKSRHSAIDGRTTRHESHALSHKHRKRIEEAFGWAKTVSGRAQIG